MSAEMKPLASDCRKLCMPSRQESCTSYVQGKQGLLAEESWSSGLAPPTPEESSIAHLPRHSHQQQQQQQQQVSSNHMIVQRPALLCRVQTYSQAGSLSASAPPGMSSVQFLVSCLL